MTRVYRYVHVSDDGRAPCIDRNLLTLATCKPVIRRRARTDDWVMGFYPSPAPAGVLCWAARISAVLQHDDYERTHRGRADAVYRAGPNGDMIRLQRDYHPTREDMDKDLSGPALLFDPGSTWYFGDAPELLPAGLIHLAARGQGHRVNGCLEGDEDRLESWLRGLRPPGFHGKPRHGDGACGPCGPSRRARRRVC